MTVVAENNSTNLGSTLRIYAKEVRIGDTITVPGGIGVVRYKGIIHVGLSASWPLVHLHFYDSNNRLMFGIVRGEYETLDVARA